VVPTSVIATLFLRSMGMRRNQGLGIGGWGLAGAEAPQLFSTRIG
jgi:hypothetical protein